MPDRTEPAWWQLTALSDQCHALLADLEAELTPEQMRGVARALDAYGHLVLAAVRAALLEHAHGE